MTYRITRVDGDDEEIADTIKWLHEATFANSAPQVDPAEDGGHWWLAYEGKEPVGFAGLRKAFFTRDTGYLNRSGVLPAHRGHKLQARLIRAREAMARKLGFVWIVTDTTDNPRSANTLIGVGYRMYTPVHPWGLAQAIYWRKKL